MLPKINELSKIKFSFPKINLTLQLILIIVGSLLFGQYIPVFYKSFFLSISMGLKEVLIFCLPIIIFVCLFSSLLSNQGRAFRFVCVVFLVVCVSNYLSILASYGIGRAGLSFIKLSVEQNINTLPVLEPLWTFHLPSYIANEHALLLGLGLGLLFSFLPYKKPVEWAKKANHAVTVFLKKGFIPLLPLFAFGFIIKLDHEGVLNRVIHSYAPIVVLMVLGSFGYVLAMFGIAANFRPKPWFNYVKNVLPAGLLGFSTISSLATMPVTLNVAEKNTGQPELARAIIPATVNIHMIGDSISIPILAMAVLLTFGHPLPSFAQYLIFAQVFLIAKFAVPGVPCGTIWILLPIFEKYFGFTSEMSAFVGAVYILFDSFVTAANVSGNSALVIILARILKWSPSRMKSKEKALVGEIS